MYAQVAFLAFSLVVSLLFFLYGFNLYYLLSAARRYRPPELPETSGHRPTVAIHLPVYNEKYVVRRLADACADMVRKYGTERASILVIDDSDDDTAAEIDEIVGQYRDTDLRVEVLRRQSRTGFKAGALQAALDTTEEEFISSARHKRRDPSVRSSWKTRHGSCWPS
jgi:cellulose synthase/poly-beta-1,6-N-acetylglucosamine synthase-like glycosyltransferase